jgi:hypothetical protein
MDIINVGDTCRTSTGRLARSVGYGWALAVKVDDRGDEKLLVLPLRQYDGSQDKDREMRLPSDKEVAQVFLNLSRWGFRNAPRAP